MKPVLVVGGAPRLAVDAVRFLSVRASGTTARQLAEGLRACGVAVDLLLGSLAEPALPALRYDSRSDLEAGLRAWISAHPEGIVVMSAAINDYEVEDVVIEATAGAQHFPPGAKIPSGAESLVIRLKPASKVIDQLRGWGLRGPIIGFKYEAADTVIAAAERLKERTGAALVVANSLDGNMQALVGDGCQRFAERKALITALIAALVGLAARG